MHGVDPDSLARLVRPEVLDLKPYASQLTPGCIKLDANENPFDWPAGMRRALAAEDMELTRYPDGTARELREAIAGYTGTEQDGILVGNGSDELIQLIFSTFGGPGRSVLLHPPTFSMYQAAAQVTGTGSVQVPLAEGVKLDLASMLAAARLPEVSVIIVCNPNNPTGTLFAREDILTLVQETGKIVVVDEAYAEFADETLADEVANFPNLLVLRTFSKAFGLAGLRLGYVLGQPATIAWINRVRQPFNVNAFSQKAGILALAHRAEYREQIAVLKSETQKIYEGLLKIPGIRVWPTHANFVLLQTSAAVMWAEELLARGLAVRCMGELPGLGPCLRVSAGLPAENTLFLAAISELAGNSGDKMAGR